MCSNIEVEGGDAVTAELTALLARLGALADADTTPGGAVSDAARIDRIRVLERIRSTVAAAQQTEMVGFARSQAEAQIADDRVDPEKVGRGIADQVALACRVSPGVGSRRLEVARVLWAEMPETRALLVVGRISEGLAEKIVSETSHLDPEQRRLVDKQLAGDELDAMGLKKAVAAVRRRSYEADRAGYTARARKARKDRRVTLRPAPDTMAWLTLLLPVEQGAACYAALRKHADAHVGHGTEERTPGQLMTDTAVERLTGQAHAEDVDVEVNLVIPWDALLPDHADDPVGGQSPIDEPATSSHHADTEDAGTHHAGTHHGDTDDAGSHRGGTDHTATYGPITRADIEQADAHAARADAGHPATDEPDGGGPESDGSDSPGRGETRSNRGAVGMAELLGYGPIPMSIVRDILASTAGKRWWRRLFTAPATDSEGTPLIGGDPRRRRFDGFLAHLLRLRDHGTCRDPYCDAPIRHYDHIRQSRAGGPTSFTNGRGVCARGNFVREMPDWHVEVIDDGLHGKPHTTRTTTPTGHTYTSRAGPAP